MYRRDANLRHPKPGMRSDARGSSSRSRTSSKARNSVKHRGPAPSFVLYVEGARDREILECWARRVDADLAKCVASSTVILGGRQPARALMDFEKRGGYEAGWKGLVVLDRDDHASVRASLSTAEEDSGGEPGGLTADPAATAALVTLGEEAGLDLFIWGQRHIESYLLVPAAIRRVLGRMSGVETDEAQVDRILGQAVMEGDARSAGSDAERERAPHAKRMLGSRGVLSEAFGVELQSSEIAKAMRESDLHADVHSLFARITQLAALRGAGPEVVIRSPRP